jgi:hypothetical protein
MRSLKQYIFESRHIYEVTIHIVGEIEPNKMELFKHNLKKFDPVEITGPTTTPIQPNPFGFPEHSNEAVNIIKAKFRYPATEPMVKQMARLIGCDENRVRLMGADYAESMEAEAEKLEQQRDDSPLLEKDYPEDAEAKEAAKAYGESYLSSIKEFRSEMKIDYAGEKTKQAFDPFKPEEYMKTMGTESPMSKINRPAKPRTGAGA